MRYRPILNTFYPGSELVYFFCVLFLFVCSIKCAAGGVDQRFACAWCFCDAGAYCSHD